MGDFASIATRYNGSEIDADWFNALQVAGAALEAIVGDGSIGSTDFTFANNVSSPTNVTGCLFQNTSTVCAKVSISAQINTSTTEIRTYIEVYVAYSSKNSIWELIDAVEHGDTPSGLVFSITGGGQLQYTSANIGGSSYDGASQFKAESF